MGLEGRPIGGGGGAGTSATRLPRRLRIRELSLRAAGPDRLWVMDVTEHPTGDGKVYLAITSWMPGRGVSWAGRSRIIAPRAGV